MGYFDPGPHIRVGTGLMIIRDNKVLLGKRKGSHGEGEYAWAGGGVDYGETIIEGVLRELKEECGSELKVTEPKLLCITDLTAYYPQHWLDIGMICEYISGEAIVMEPDKCESWDWYDMNNLPSPLFKCATAYIEAYKTGKNYFSMGL